MNRGFRAFFMPFFLSYSIVVLVNIAAFSIVFMKTYRASELQFVESAKQLLEGGKDLMDVRLGEVEENARNLARDVNVMKLIWTKDPMETRDHLTLWRLRNSFQYLNLQSTFVHSVYLIVKNSGAVVSNNFVNTDISWVYPHFLSYEGMTYPDWESRIALWEHATVFLPLSRVTLFDSTENVVTFKLPISTDALQQNAAMVVLITDESIRFLFQDIASFNGDISIFDRSGTALFSTADPETNDVNGLFIETESDRYGLIYRASLPAAYLRNQLRPIFVMFSGLLLGTLFAGLFIAVFFSLRNSRPLTRLFAIISSSPDFKAEDVQYQYAWLEESMEKLVGERIDVRRALERQSHMIESGFFERLLRGGYLYEEEITACADELHVQFPQAPCAVALVIGVTMPETVSYIESRMVIHNFFKHNSVMPCIVHDTNEGNVLIVPCREETARVLSEMQRRLLSEIGMIVRIGIGKARNEFIELHHSLNEAFLSLKVAPENTQDIQICVFQDKSDNPVICLYDFKDEQHLYNTALIGDEHGAIEALRRIRNSIPRQPPASTTALQAFLSDIASTIVKIVEAVPGNYNGIPRNYIQYLNGFTSCDDFFSRAEEVLKPVCAAVYAAKAPPNDLFRNRFMAYLNTHYDDPLICLHSVAEYLDLNFQYLSRLIKEQTGDNFAAILEGLRMKKAEELMQTSTLPVRSIATKVGYTSWNSFYKAFKRIYGISPGRYRQQS